MVTGQEEPVLQGWMALGHGKRGFRPIPALSFSLRKAGPAEFAYVFLPATGTVPEVSLARAGDGRGFQAAVADTRYEVSFDTEGRPHLSSGKIH